MVMDLTDFVLESNKVEGLHHSPKSSRFQEELEAHEWFVNLGSLRVSTLQEFVSIIQPDAFLRIALGIDVKVGDHFPPRGGPSIEIRLSVILEDMEINGPHKTHLAYENLHPFTDGNGRSGRVLWLWQMGGVAPLGFLHSFYYQTLAEQRLV